MPTQLAEESLLIQTEWVKVKIRGRIQKSRESVYLVIQPDNGLLTGRFLIFLYYISKNGKASLKLGFDHLKLRSTGKNRRSMDKSLNSDF